jgi:Ala-tRNA(Pro) deacylase
MPISTRLKNHLEENEIPYSLLSHPSAYTCQGAAAVMHVSGSEVAKTVVVQAGKDYYLAVLPASYHVKPDKLAHVIGCPVHLATETEFSSLFPDCERGAVPPLGELYGLGVSGLSGCFSKPQLVVYGHAAPSVCENLARVPVDVLYRRSLPEVSG